MKLREFIGNDIQLKKLLEFSASGTTATGSIASLPMAGSGVIKRMPTEPNLFGYVAAPSNKLKKKRKTQR